MISLFLLKTFIWCIAIYGITQIITESNLFEPFRNFFVKSKLSFLKWFGKLVSCFLCCSVWVSFISSPCIFSPSLELWPHLSYGSIFVDGMIGSTLVWFLHILENKLS